MKGLRIILTLVLASALSINAYAQKAVVRDFRTTCTTMTKKMYKHMGVYSKLEIKTATKNGDKIDFNFSETLGDFPWRDEEIEWFKEEFKANFPKGYEAYEIGTIKVKGNPLEEYSLPMVGNGGKPTSDRFLVEVEPKRALVTYPDRPTVRKGLAGRHIAIWQSHGMYYADGIGWKWQRAPLFQTIEDLYTQTYVIPYLVPMLENAGANVLLPRERDWQKAEVIVDNDGAGFTGHGRYEETGTWSDGGQGFADTASYYLSGTNPFTLGTARSTTCGTARWTPDIPEKGRYAVYVSYKATYKNTSSALYTVHHLGGDTHFKVNQKISGSTWVYLGTFDFAKGASGYVTLETNGARVNADAVRFGGGMGNIARQDYADTTMNIRTSGMPRFAEGSRYWLQWAGAPKTVYSPHEDTDDYKDDYKSRAYWVNWMLSKGVPVDVSLAFHTDAGTYQGDTIVGTLAIYTAMKEQKREFPDGSDRLTNREFADIVQTQVVNDLKTKFNPEWSRRQTWDRGYAESRQPDVPAMLLELLSHQNFEDMKYGMDPEFKFTVCRAVYKGILKYLSNHYGVDYVVQPLPVKDFSAIICGKDSVALSWTGVKDPLEPTAKPRSYIVYTRIDENGWDNGTAVNAASTVMTVEPGHVYSYKVVAVNQGGISFPSEILACGISDRSDKKVLVVNNFTRLAAPAYDEDTLSCGFRNRIDSGVQYGPYAGYIGETYEFNRSLEWVSDDDPGFGASFLDHAGDIISGNTFDYVSLHGRFIMDAGYSFCSSSTSSFSSGNVEKGDYMAVDLICGKQITSPHGAHGGTDYAVFSDGMMGVIRDWTSSGIDFLVSGSHIGSDLDGTVYPIQIDSTYSAKAVAFAAVVLGYIHPKTYCNDNKVTWTGRDRNMKLNEEFMTFCFNNQPDRNIYSVETGDVIGPASSTSRAIFKYAGKDLPAGIYNSNGRYKTVCLGFPIEAITDFDSARDIIAASLNFFENTETTTK